MNTRILLCAVLSSLGSISSFADVTIPANGSVNLRCGFTGNGMLMGRVTRKVVVSQAGEIAIARCAKACEIDMQSMSYGYIYVDGYRESEVALPYADREKNLEYMRQEAQRLVRLGKCEVVID